MFYLILIHFNVVNGVVEGVVGVDNFRKIKLV